MADELERWAQRCAPELLARAETDAVAVLRDALVAAALQERATRAARSRSPWAPARQAASPFQAPVRGDDLLWAYGVVGADAPAPPADRPGIAAGDTVRRIEVSGLAALVSRVPRAEFDAEPLRSNLNDLAWLEHVARGHEAVLDHAVAVGAIVPLRLCTIFEDEAGVRAMLERDHDALAEALRLLAGRQEWGAKLLVDPHRLAEQARAGSDEAAAVDSTLDTRSAGGAYLERRRLERHVRAQADSLAAQLAQEVHARLSDAAVDAVTRPPQNRDLSGHEGEMVLNGAYLVAADDIDDLRAAVAELEQAHRALGARIELTGPWPPYNFLPRGGAAALV